MVGQPEQQGTRQSQCEDPFEFQRRCTESRTSEEKRKIARIKRLCEWLMADAEFRLALKQYPEKAASLAAERGLAVDPMSVAPLWADGFTTILPKKTTGQHPDLDLWVDWVLDIARFRDLLRLEGDPGEHNPRVHAWRRRQIFRNDMELGPRNRAITYPLFSYELTLGCSVRCWFCALSAPRLQGIFRYSPANGRLWRDVLETALRVVGPRAARTGVCYHATEPADNPDYFRFLDDYREVNGILCQTTTAAAMRNSEWTGRLLDMYERHDSVKSRFSILTLDTLRKVHQTFDPDRMLRIECLMHNRESMIFKAHSGRAAQSWNSRWENEYRARVAEKAGMERPEGTPEPGDVSVPKGMSGTIACIAGFLVNMVEKTVRLVSPCESSDRWPHGYRIHAEGRFETTADYGELIERFIDEHMPMSLPSGSPVSFRRGLHHEETQTGFKLASRNRKVSFSASEAPYRTAGRLIAEGKLNSARILDALVDAGEDYLVSATVLSDLFEKGVLEDEPWEDGSRLAYP
ncbi:MAG: radical SAM family RiPP maturation amino acid epimerase [Acidobacteriota bacterium]